jgi:hypothetical protein
MQARQNWFRGVELADNDGEMFLAAIGRAEGDDLDLLDTLQRHARRTDAAEIGGSVAAEIREIPRLDAEGMIDP